ncbi:hypothetical protein Tco_0323223 [Tanacetum coccineum]
MRIQELSLKFFGSIEVRKASNSNGDVEWTAHLMNDACKVETIMEEVMTASSKVHFGIGEPVISTASWCSSYWTGENDTWLEGSRVLNELFRPIDGCSSKPNTGKQEKERRTCLDYLKYEESRVRIKYGRILKKKKSNYSKLPALRSSCNEDMGRARSGFNELMVEDHIQIFYHGLDEPTQAILDAGGIFLYKTQNAHQLLEDRVLLKLDWSKENKTKPLRGDMKEMRDGCNKCRGPHPSSDCDDKPMGGPKEEESKLCIQRISWRIIDEIIMVDEILAIGSVSHENQNSTPGKILQNKIPPKLGDPESFLIPCKLANSVEYLALADLGASINLMPYSLYAALSGLTLKPTRMNFIILQMEEDDRVPLILGRPFLHTADAIIRVKIKELNLGIREDRATFHIDKAMHHSHVNDDTCFKWMLSMTLTEDELKLSPLRKEF